MEKICPKCGASSSKREFVGNFCVSCLKVDMACPHKLEIWKCKKCGRSEVAGERELEKLVLKSCKGKYENARFDAEKGEAVFLVKVGNAFIEVRRKIEVAVKEKTCDMCGRAAGGYFEAIIQLRGNPEKVERFCEKLTRAIEQQSFVAKLEELHEGIDIYVGNKKAAEDALAKYKLEFTRSETLGGMKDGKRVYRSTFCIRL